MRYSAAVAEDNDRCEPSACRGEAGASSRGAGPRRSPELAQGPCQIHLRLIRTSVLNVPDSQSAARRSAAAARPPGRNRQGPVDLPRRWHAAVCGVVAEAAQREGLLARCHGNLGSLVRKSTKAILASTRPSRAPSSSARPGLQPAQEGKMPSNLSQLGQRVPNARRSR